MFGTKVSTVEPNEGARRPNTMRATWWAVVLVCAAACASPDSGGVTIVPSTTEASTTTQRPETTTPATRARQLWASVPSRDYVYVLNRACTDCDQRRVGSFRITVRNGVVAAVEQVPTRTPLPTDLAPTIDELLTELETLRLEEPDVEFDETLGIPLSAELGPEDSFVIDFFHLDLADRRKELEEARRTWVEAGPDDYTITWNRQCFCAPEDIGPFETRVNSGNITESVRIDPSTGEEPARHETTVEQLFATIEQYLDQHPVEIEVSYEPVLGFPVRMFADVDLMMADEEFGFEVLSLLPAP